MAAAAQTGRPVRSLRSLPSIVAAAMFGALLGEMLHGRGAVHTPSAATPMKRCGTRPLLPPKSRVELGELLEKEGLTTGAELGVQRGNFSKTMLDSWHSCKLYLMIDLWAQQENYKEAANVGDAEHLLNHDMAQHAVEAYRDKAQLWKMSTSEAAKLIEDASLDFVYIDARHDYCGVGEDIAQWCPKVRPGGIMSGHDYLDAQEILDYHPDEDWGLCANGTRNDGAVKGAVADFSARLGLTVAVTYREWEQHPFATWMVRKPAC